MEKTESALELSGLHKTASVCPEQGLQPRVNKLIVSSAVFTQTMFGLMERSDGKRESAAIWAGRVVDDSDWIASRLYFYHDLCDDHAGALFLELSQVAKFRLYEELSKENLRIVAALHTHPNSWVDLSDVDKRNQLSSRIGFWSIVLPHYGRKPWTISRMGVHIRSLDGWKRLSKIESRQRIIVER